jgi:hypothetical protein
MSQDAPDRLFDLGTSVIQAQVPVEVKQLQLYAAIAGYVRYPDLVSAPPSLT